MGVLSAIKKIPNSDPINSSLMSLETNVNEATVNEKNIHRQALEKAAELDMIHAWKMAMEAHRIPNDMLKDKKKISDSVAAVKKQTATVKEHKVVTKKLGDKKLTSMNQQADVKKQTTAVKKQTTAEDEDDDGDDDEDEDEDDEDE